MLDLKILKVKLSFMIYEDFESILVPEDNEKMSLTPKKYQKHVACSYGYKLVCVDDKFSLAALLSHTFADSMLEDSKYCCDMMKIILTKIL